MTVVVIAVTVVAVFLSRAPSAPKNKFARKGASPPEAGSAFTARGRFIDGRRDRGSQSPIQRSPPEAGSSTVPPRARGRFSVLRQRQVHRQRQRLRQRFSRRGLNSIEDWGWDLKPREGLFQMALCFLVRECAHQICAQQILVRKTCAAQYILVGSRNCGG